MPLHLISGILGGQKHHVLGGLRSLSTGSLSAHNHVARVLLPASRTAPLQEARPSGAREATSTCNRPAAARYMLQRT